MTLSSASFTLLEQLIQHLLGDDIDHATLTRLAQKSAASLEKFKAMSTDEHHIEKRWQSLCEKFMIKGYDDLADKLVKDKIMFLEPRRELISDIAAAQQRILKYDMLSLLLALSRNPTQKQKHLLTSTILSNDVSQANFWKEVLVEEPMEGDHWMEWENLSEGSQETADEFELDHERLSRYQRRKPQELHDTAEDMMWDEKSTVMQRIHLEDRDIKDLSNRQYWETKTDITEKIISDADLMREILFLLQGHPGMIFKRNEEDDNFKLVMNYNRPEQPSFLSIKSCLEEFCFHGNTLLSLRLWVARCLESDVKVYGQTSQAFAVSVATFLRSLDKYMADIQVSFCRAGDTRIVSLLHLKSALRPFLDRVDATHDVLIDALGDDVHRPRDIAMRILRSLTASIENHQSSGRMDICQHLMRMYKDTMVPMGRMIDDWVMYGSLAGDVADEFFISRSEDIPDHSPDFWSDGFKLHSDESISVIFDTHFLQQAFAAGKSIHIISHFEHYTHSTNKPSLTFLQNLSCHVNFPSNPDEISTPRASTTMQDDDDTDDKTDLLHQILFPLGRRCSLDRQRTHHTSSSTTHQPPMEIFLFGRDVAECQRTYISKPYQQSSLKLNKVLEEKCGLSRHLRALASVYLMLHDHTMHTFCELLFQRMDKHRFPVDAIQLNKLFKEANALSGRTPDFDAAASVGITDMVFDDGDADYLGRITLHYELPWPVNNFIKQSSLAEYSKVTTLLLRLKRAKHILERHMLFESQHDMRLYSLRMKLVWFVNTFWGYVMTTVLHAETNLLESAVRETHDIDRISALHASYVSKIVDRCLLGEKTRSIQKAILDILKIVHDLARLFSGERKLSPDVQVLEKEFNRSNEFIGTTLKIIARKGGFPWFDALASSLSAQ